jgi:hypothetical protein
MYCLVDRGCSGRALLSRRPAPRNTLPPIHRVRSMEIEDRIYWKSSEPDSYASAHIGGSISRLESTSDSAGVKPWPRHTMQA